MISIRYSYPDLKVVEHVLDANGNPTRTIFPDGYYYDRVFDQLNRMTDIKLNGASSSALVFQFNDLSLRKKLTYQNGVVTDYGFEADSDINSIVQTFVGSSVTFTYGSDKTHLLTSQSVSDGQYMWHPGAGGTVTYATANDVNQYGTVGGATQSHDSNGNLTGDGTWTFGYNTENQLTSASKTGVSASYVYDPYGRQTQKTVGSAKTRFIYAGWQRIADYDGVSGNLVSRYVYGKGLDEPLIEVSSGGTLTYFHHDRMGSIVAKTDSTGAVTNKYKYSPFGESAALSGTSFGFQGQRYDSEHGLYYMKYRYYNPTTGRFLQPDPLGLVAGFNLYTFVDNDPLNGSDPMGLLKWGFDFVNEAGLAGLGLNAVNAMNPNNRPIGLPMPSVGGPSVIIHGAGGLVIMDGSKNPKPGAGGGGGGNGAQPIAPPQNTKPKPLTPEERWPGIIQTPNGGPGGTTTHRMGVLVPPIAPPVIVDIGQGTDPGYDAPSIVKPIPKDRDPFVGPNDPTIQPIPPGPNSPDLDDPGIGQGFADRVESNRASKREEWLQLFPNQSAAQQLNDALQHWTGPLFRPR